MRPVSVIWYGLQAEYWAMKWADYTFNPLREQVEPKQKECARLAAHFAILTLEAI